MLLIKIRNSETLEYLDVNGVWIKNYIPADCNFMLLEDNNHFKVKHGYSEQFFHGCGSLSDTCDSVRGHFKTYQCPKTFMTMLQYFGPISKEHDSNQDCGVEPTAQWIIEENTETQIDVVPYGSCEYFNDSQLKEMADLSKGGEVLGKYAIEENQGATEIASLIKWMNKSTKEGIQPWVEVKLASGNLAAIARHGSAYISVIVNSQLSPAALAAKSMYLSENATTMSKDAEIVDVSVAFHNGKNSKWQNLLMIGEQGFIGGLLYVAARSIAMSGVKALGNLLAETRIVSRLSVLEARGLQAAFRANGCYGVFKTVGARLVSGSVRLVCAAVSFAAVAIAVYVIAEFIIPFIWKRQQAIYTVRNFSNKGLQLRLNYTSNVPKSIQENDENAPFILPAMTKVGDPIEILPNVWATSEDNVVHSAEFSFTNDSTFMQGFGLMLQITNNEIELPNNQALYASIDIPWTKSNTINLSVGDAEVNQEKKAKVMLEKYDRLSYQNPEGKVYYNAEVGIDALKGNDNTYVAFLSVK